MDQAQEEEHDMSTNQQPDNSDTVRPHVDVHLDDQIRAVADLAFELIGEHMRSLSDAEPSDLQAWTVAAAILSAATQRAAMFAIRHGADGVSLARTVRAAAQAGMEQAQNDIRAGS
jgi:hypothetical protein